MANYMNVANPRFYCDYINYRLSRGIAQNGNYDVGATNSGANLVGIKSGGGSEIELFDMKPFNQVTFDTSADTTKRQDHVVVTLDVMGENASKKSFVAKLNHNLKSAGGKIRISSSDTKSHVQLADFGSATDAAPTEILNADTISGNLISPNEDGSTIVTFSEEDNRYWGIQFEGSGSEDATTSGNYFTDDADLKIGCILIGEFYDLPQSPDVDVKRTVAFDTVNIEESLGGHRYSTMISHGRQAADQNKSPFVTTTTQQQVFGGRLSWDMNFSFLDSDEVMPVQWNTYNPSGDSVINDAWNLTNGGHIPFIFSCDNSQTGTNAETAHIFARFAQDSLVQTQVSPNLWNIALKIEEEF